MAQSGAQGTTHIVRSCCLSLSQVPLVKTMRQQGRLATRRVLWYVCTPGLAKALLESAPPSLWPVASNINLADHLHRSFSALLIIFIGTILWARYSRQNTILHDLESALYCDAENTRDRPC